MSQSGFTPIQLYRSSTAAAVPTAGNLVAGELAINTTDEKLYFENASGVVKLLASSAATGGTFTTIANGLGAVGTPSYTFTGDLNTGIWSPAADTVAVSTAGAEAMRIISGGYVGIGTTAPAYLLDAQQTLNGTGGINYVNSSTGASSAATIGAEAGGSYFYHKVTRATGVVQFRGVTATTLNQDFTTQIFRSTGGTEYARIDSSGNVGIGTSAPGYKLDVFATGNISGQFKTSGSINALFLADAGTTAESLYVGTVGNDFRVVTGSSERMRVLSTGLVGIGTTAPGAKLEILATSAGATVEVLRLNNPGGGANTAAQIKFNAAGANYASITGGYGAAAPQMTFNLPSGAGNYVWQQASTDKMVLDTSGFLGIGTSAPASILDVATTGAVVATVRSTSTSGARDAKLRLNVASTGGDDPAGQIEFTFGTGYTVAGSIQMTHTNPAMKFFTSTSERMRLDGSGYLLVGATSSLGAGAVRTQIGSAASAATGFLLKSTTASLSFYASSGTSTNITYNSGNFLAFGEAPDNLSTFTERMRIDTSGNVGIGTTAPTGKLAVSVASSGTFQNALVSSNGVDSDLLVRIKTSVSDIYNSAGVITFSTGGSGGIERMRIDSNGNLLAGTTTSNGRFTIGDNSGGINGFSAIQSIAGGYNFSSNATSNGGTYYHFIFQQSSVSVGSITSSGSTTAYNTSSDYRLKDINGPIASSGAYIDALKPVQGSWKADGGRFIGLLAHEVQEVSETRIATGEKDGKEMQAMDYSAPEIVANLIAEVQSLRARVAQLEGK